MTEDELPRRLAEALAALLSDPDIDWIRGTGRALRVSRRGQREALAAELDDDLVAALRERAHAGAADVALPDGYTLRAVCTPAGTVHFVAFCRPRPRTMMELVEAGAVAGDVATALMNALLAGRPILISGPHRAGRGLLRGALWTEATQRAECTDLDGPDAWGPDRTRALEHAVALGVDMVFVRCRGPEAARWLRAGPVVVLDVEGLDADTRRGLAAQFDAVWARCGHAPTGGLEVALPDEGARPPAPVLAPVMLAPPVAGPAPAAAALVPSRARPEPEPDADLPPLVPLPEGPPSGWATDDDTAGPGWELSDGPGPALPAEALDVPVDPSQGGGGGDFASALAAVKDRPTFVPKRPAAHPQTRALREQSAAPDDAPDPLGGLTLEPPPGGEGA